MAGQFGVDQLKKIVSDLAEIANVVDKVLHKGGLISLIGLLGPVNDLKGVDLAVVKQEISELSEDERKEVEAKFKSLLQLTDANIQSKVVGMVDCLDQVIGLVGKALKLVEDGKGVVAKVKQILVQP